jgi:hypothetical protein
LSQQQDVEFSRNHSINCRICPFVSMLTPETNRCISLKSLNSMAIRENTRPAAWFVGFVHGCYIGCPTTYQTRYFFNISKTNEDIATKQTHTHTHTHTPQTHSSSFLTKRTYSCSNLVAISSLVLELLKKCRVW